MTDLKKSFYASSDQTLHIQAWKGSTAWATSFNPFISKLFYFRKAVSKHSKQRQWNGVRDFAINHIFFIIYLLSQEFLIFILFLLEIFGKISALKKFSANRHLKKTYILLIMLTMLLT